jgi:uncharacterized protein YkwD
MSAAVTAAPSAGGAAGAGAALRTAPAGGACAGEDAAVASTPVAALRAAVLCLVDQQRAARGLSALADSGDLDSSAQSWTETMVSSGRFTHGSDFGRRFAAAGYDWSAVGEDIAAGANTPATAMMAWMASPEHCANILDPAFTGVGIGVDPSSVGGGVHGATWTEDFGRPAGVSAPAPDLGPMDGCPYSVSIP